MAISRLFLPTVLGQLAAMAALWAGPAGSGPGSGPSASPPGSVGSGMPALQGSGGTAADPAFLPIAPPTPEELEAEINDPSANPFRGMNPVPAPAADAIAMAPLVVRGNRPIVIPEAELYTPAAFTDILMRRYLTEFDWGVLNRFTLPLFGSQSREKRAHEIYDQDQLKELKDEGRLFREPDFGLSQKPAPEVVNPK
jgi:hypothetical protein